MQRSAFTLLMLGVLCVSRTAKADVILVEGFDQATIPTGWTCSNASFVSYVTSSTYPPDTGTATPYEGTHFVKFASYSAAAGIRSQLKSPAMSTVGMTDIKVMFAWYGFAGTKLDRVNLQYSTDGTTWKNVAEYKRIDYANGWIQLTCALPAGATNQSSLQIAFEFVSDNGRNCYLDYVRVLALPAYYASAVTVTNVTASQAGNSKYVDITYDLLNPAGGMCEVAVEVSTNSGATYVVRNSTNMTGDIGYGVSVGLQKLVEWFAYYTGGDLPADIYPDARVRVTASVSNMAYIAAGAFWMGTNLLAYETDITDAMRHDVNVSAFFMDKYEVSSQMWMEVYVWATNRGYRFSQVSDVYFKTKAPQHPVQYVTWYDSVIWCNARSQKEGLTPCYYSTSAQTVLYTNLSATVGQGLMDLASNQVKWVANGYRLPTEAEWEKSARGGVANTRFPWSDANTITNSRANYYGDTSELYDLGPNGNNPRFNDGTVPYTSPVGYFAANSYGLYDMAGNVSEWCWDWYGSTYYQISPKTDPLGPTTAGTTRVVRGGNCGVSAATAPYCRVADRYALDPNTKEDRYGFRCVRR